MTDENDIPDDDSRTAKWQVGPFSLGVIVVMVLLDLVLVFGGIDTEREAFIEFLYGITFGQAGAISLLTFSRGTRQRLLVAVASLVGGGLMAVLAIFGTGDSLDEVAMFALIFLQYQLGILCGLFLYGMFLQGSNRSDWQPRFVVRQLLAIMIITALVATIIRIAREDIGQLMDSDTWIPVSLWTVTAIAAGLLLLNHPPSLWRLGAFAAAGLAIGYLCSRLIDWGPAIYVSVVQMATLAVCLIVPQFDRYTLRVALEPRDQPPSEQHLDENA